jgi:sialidase-1
MNLGLLVILVFMACGTLQCQERVFFAAGDLGHEYFRIPALVQWEGGELFAFAEGRKSNCVDFGNMDILMRRSMDSVRTWYPALVLVDNGDLQAGNSTPIVDRLGPRFSKGRILLFDNTVTKTRGCAWAIATAIL